MIIVIHENKEWIAPFALAFESLELNHDFWYLPEMSLDLANSTKCSLLEQNERILPYERS